MDRTRLLLALLVTLFQSLWTSGAQSRPSFAAPIGTQTATVGRNAALTCVVEDLGNYKVAWIHMKRKIVLSIHHTLVTSSSRYRVVREDARTWVLHISQVQPSDAGYYMCQVNTKPLLKQVGLLKINESPRIEDVGSSESEVSVRARENVTLTCRASGVPPPVVLWKREDDLPMRAVAPSHQQHKFERHHYLGSHWRGLPVVVGSSLNLTRVTHADMGAYLCIAANEVPPATSKRIQLNVEFKPMIRVAEQLLLGTIGGSVTLRCTTEAFPTPIVYWRRNDTESGGLIMNSTKYHTSVVSKDYITKMVLKIHQLNASDLGSYMCVCKNYIGMVTGHIELFELVEPRLPPTTTPTYQRWNPPTDFHFRNGGASSGEREREGERSDVYIPEDEEEQIIEDLEAAEDFSSDQEEQRRARQWDVPASAAPPLTIQLLVAPLLWTCAWSTLPGFVV